MRKITNKNGLATVDKSTHEADGIVRRLSIKARSRLIQEEERWLRHQLHT